MSAALIDAARRYIGTPWRHMGDSRSGMDCAGLLVAAARDCGIVAPLPVHSPLPALSLFDDLLPRYCDRIAEPQAGAVLRLSVAGRPQHLAIVGQHPMQGLSIIHADMRNGVCEHRLDFKWLRRVVSCWLPKET